MRILVAPTDSGRWLTAVALAVLTAVAAWRVPAVATTPPLVQAHGERTWMAWSYRDADADRHLAAVAARLETPPTCLSIVIADAAGEPAWWHRKALYHLRRHRVLEVVRAGEAPAAGAECLGLRQTPAGGFRIVRRTRE